jgi:hypothetical protein
VEVKLSIEELGLVERALDRTQAHFDIISRGYDDPKPLRADAKAMRALLARVRKPLDAVRDDQQETQLIRELSKVRARIKQRKAVKS